MRSLTKFWRREVIKNCVYIDDGLGASPSLDLEEAVEEAEFVKQFISMWFYYKS